MAVDGLQQLTGVRIPEPDVVVLPPGGGQRPSRRKASRVTVFPCPSKVRRSVRSFTSQSLMRPSSPDEARRRPSELKITSHVAPLCAAKV